MEPRIPDIRFQCPRCGGSEFGSFIERLPDGPMQRLCHGYVGQRSCGFGWPDQDDWKYFLVEGVRLDAMEYDAVMARIRSMRFTVAYIDIEPGDLPLGFKNR